MDLYAKNILDRYKNPLYFCDDPLTDEWICHEEANHSCGDRLRVCLRLQEGRIASYAFSGQGCAISMASADLLGDVILNRSAEDALSLTKEDVYGVLGIEISLRRSKCALLALLALQNGLLKEGGRALKSWSDYHL